MPLLRSILTLAYVKEAAPASLLLYLVYIDIIHNAMYIYQRSTVSHINFTCLRQITLRLDSTFHVESNLYHHVALEPHRSVCILLHDSIKSI